MDGWMDGWVVVNDILHLLRKVVGKCIQMPRYQCTTLDRWMYGWKDGWIILLFKNFENLFFF
jgi:hypothetical protein